MGHHGIGIRSLEKSAHSIIQNSRTTISCLLSSTVHMGGLDLESFSLNLCSGANIKCPPDAKRKESLVSMEIIHVFFFVVPFKLICIWSRLNLTKDNQVDLGRWAISTSYDLHAVGTQAYSAWLCLWILNTCWWVHWGSRVSAQPLKSQPRSVDMSGCFLDAFDGWPHAWPPKLFAAEICEWGHSPRS